MAMLSARSGAGAEQERSKERSKERSSGEVVDEALLTLMRAPKSYTREDVVGDQRARRCCLGTGDPPTGC